MLTGTHAEGKLDNDDRSPPWLPHALTVNLLDPIAQENKNSAVMIWLNHEHHPKYPKDISVDYCMGKHCHIRARCSKWEVQAGFDPPKLLGSCWNEFPWLLRAIDPCKHGKASPWLNKPFLAVVLPKDATTTKKNYLGPSPEQAMVKGQLRAQGSKGQRWSKVGGLQHSAAENPQLWSSCGQWIRVP